VFAPEARAPRAGVDVRAVIEVPELTPHDLRHGVAMEMYGEHGDLGEVRALLGHQRIDTTQIYASIRPTQLKRSVEFLEAKASRMLEASSDNRASCFRSVRRFSSERLQTRSVKHQRSSLGGPNGIRWLLYSASTYSPTWRFEDS
jgi:hypothetical protein